MGRITIFIKPNCKFCTKAECVLVSAVRKHVFPMMEQPDYVGIEIAVVDISRDPARARQCTELSGGRRTVPQIFLGRELVGSASTCTVFDACGELARRLKKLATQPHDRSFPPAPETSLLKLTEDCALSGQPSPQQLRGLFSFGFRSVVSLVHPDEPSFRASEARQCESSGLAFVAVPPEACAYRATVKHVEADLAPRAAGGRADFGGAGWPSAPRGGACPLRSAATAAIGGGGAPAPTLPLAPIDEEDVMVAQLSPETLREWASCACPELAMVAASGSVVVAPSSPSPPSPADAAGAAADVCATAPAPAVPVLERGRSRSTEAKRGVVVGGDGTATMPLAAAAERDESRRHASLGTPATTGSAGSASTLRAMSSPAHSDSQSGSRAAGGGAAWVHGLSRSFEAEEDGMLAAARLSFVKAVPEADVEEEADDDRAPPRRDADDHWVGEDGVEGVGDAERDARTRRRRGDDGRDEDGEEEDEEDDQGGGERSPDSRDSRASSLVRDIAESPAFVPAVPPSLPSHAVSPAFVPAVPPSLPSHGADPVPPAPLPLAHRPPLPPPVTRRRNSDPSVASSTSSSVSDVWTFDDNDSGVGGRFYDPSGKAAYTPSWMACAVAAVDAAPKPVLVHCTTGEAACAVLLARAALAMGASVAQVHRWSRDLGHDLAADHELNSAVQALIAGRVKVLPA